MFSSDPSPPEPRLGPAPRALPLPLTLQVLFGGLVGQFGWLFFAFGMLFVWVFDAGGAVSEWLAFRGEVLEVPGVVTGWEGTNTSVNEQRVYRTFYSFRHPDGMDVEGTSYATGQWLEAGTPVTVELAPGDPVLSRITGMRTSVGGGMVLFVLVFPLVGAVLGLGSLLRRLRPLRLLRTGTLTTGVLETTESTSSHVNNQPVMKLTFRFQDARGGEHTAVAKTHRTYALQDEPRELVVYDPRNPGIASVLDELPCQPRVGPDGAFFASRSGLPTPLYLLLPGLSVLTALRYVASLM
jgi:hypothetical protein